MEWSQEALGKVQCLVLLWLFSSSGWSLCRIAYIEDYFASCVGKFMAYLGSYCNCSPASLRSALVSVRGTRELVQSACGLGRNLPFLGDDEGV